MIRITTDSTCDLGESVAKRNIGVVPLTVILGDKAYADGVNICPQDIFDYVAQTGILPKTSAPSIGDFEEAFSRFTENGDTVIHFNISQKASSTHAYAKEAAKSFPGKVYVVDSKALSSGQGLLVMKAADFATQGMSAEEIVEKVVALAPKVNTSFIPDTLDYLHKGGRCSAVSMYAASLLKIHPMIAMDDGQLTVKRKYRGNMEKCLRTYINDLKADYPVYDKSRCFITHSCADRELVDLAKTLVGELFDFEEVLETVAGSVITGHCGRNTIGVLFIAE